MMRCTSLLLLGASFIVGSAGDLFAQAFAGAGLGMGSGGGGAFGSGGAFGGGGMSGGAFGSTGGAFGSTGNAFGSANGSFSSAGFSSGFSMAGFGGSGGTTSGVGLAGGQQSMYGLPSVGSGANRGMLGSQGNVNRPQSTSTTNRSGQTGGTRGRNNTRQAQSQKALQAAQEAWFEPRVEVGFEVAMPAASAVAADVNKSFQSPALKSRFSGVRVVVEGDTAVLRGTVSSDYDRQLAEQMAMLEPSITSVRNEVAIGAPPRTNSAAAPRPNPPAGPR